jgi:hypothetical protein
VAPVGESEVSSQFYGGPLFGATDDHASALVAAEAEEPTERFDPSADIRASVSSSAASGATVTEEFPATNTSSFRDNLTQLPLDVDEDSLAQMMAMGFEAAWAALALRRCNNNLEESIFFCSENDEMKRSLLMEEEVMRRIRHGPRDRAREQQQPHPQQQDKKKSGFGSAMKSMFGLGGKKQQATPSVFDLRNIQGATEASADDDADADAQLDGETSALNPESAPPAISEEPMSFDPAPSYDEVVDNNTYTKFTYSHENTGPEMMPGVSLHRSIDARDLVIEAPTRDPAPEESYVQPYVPDATPAETAPDIEIDESLEAGAVAEPVVPVHVNEQIEHIEEAPETQYPQGDEATQSEPVVDPPPSFDSVIAEPPVEVPSQYEDVTSNAPVQLALAVSATSEPAAELLGGDDTVIGSPPSAAEHVEDDVPIEKLNVAVLVGQAIPQASVVQSSTDFEFSVTSTGVLVSDINKRASVGGSKEAVPLVDAMLPMSMTRMPREVARAYGFDGNQFYMTVAAPLLLKDEAKIEEARKKEKEEKEMERRRLQNRSFLRATSDYFYGIEDVTGASRKIDKEEIPRRRQLKASVVAEKLQNGSGSVVTGAAITLKQPHLPPNKKTPQGDRPGMVVLKLPSDIRNEKHAIKLCESMAPPLWDGDGDVLKCVSCKVSPGVFNPLHHCRNCGYYVCLDCSDKFWPSSMLPDTFHNGETVVRVCDSCHVLMELFADALRRGDVKAAFAIFQTGNVNLRRPFLIYKSRDYPIHSAVRGGSLVLLRWLLETECCPCRDTKNEPIVTSSGQCLLSLAAYYGHVDMMRYLVQRQSFSLLSITDIDVLRRGLHSALGVSIYMDML